jgi:hypothetical protein
MGKRRNNRELEKAKQEKRASSAKRPPEKPTNKAKKPFWLVTWVNDRAANIRKRYESDRKGFLLRTAYLLVMIAYALLEFWPSFITLRQTAVFDIFSRICISSLPLYFAYLSKRRPKYLFQKLLMTFLSAFFWLGLLGISGKIRMIIVLAFCWVSILYTVGLWIVKDEHFPVFNWIMFLFTFIIMLSGLSSYTFLNSPGALQFWVLPLILGILCGVICAVLLINGTIVLKDNRISERVSLVIATVAVGFFMFMSTAHHLNYALDPEPARAETVVITKMEIRSSGKSTYHELYFWYGGEERKVDVSTDTYNMTEVGDRFDILVFNGAFDKPFLREK